MDTELGAAQSWRGFWALRALRTSRAFRAPRASNGAPAATHTPGHTPEEDLELVIVRVVVFRRREWLHVASNCNYIVPFGGVSGVDLSQHEVCIDRRRSFQRDGNVISDLIDSRVCLGWGGACGGEAESDKE